MKTQIQAFQLLSHSLDIPDYIQGSLKESANLNSDQEDDDALFIQSTLETGFQDRLIRAGVPPPGGFQPPQSVSGLCERIISNRISARLTELENMPANVGTIDRDGLSLSPGYAIPEKDSDLKIKALIEYKALLLLTKQKSLRQHIIYSLVGRSDPVSESMNRRYSNRRQKVKTIEELRISEHLEYSERVNRERQLREKKIRELNVFREQAHQVHVAGNTRRSKKVNLGRSVINFHYNIQREEAKRSERTAKQRLQALRANDEEAYIKLLDQTKDSRITHLLKQTNTFLDSLTKAVKVQQGDTNINFEDKEKIDYYKVAHRIQEEVTQQPSILVGGTLKEYQLKGLQWMVSLYNNNLNGILADEMGLGKTIQSISFITYLMERKRQPGPYLVIVPLSTLTNWTLEFEKWAPSVRKIVYKGNPTQRRLLQEEIRMGNFQVLLTTFEYIIMDRPILSRIKWLLMLMDEGHRMKNSQSKLSQTLSTYYSFQHRLILTGTPLQNNLPELWALLNFVLPKIFNSVQSFDEWFNKPFDNTGGQDKLELTEEESLLIIRRLHIVLRPFLLRRLKKDVEKDLPDKVENIIRCNMSALQAKLYEQMLKHGVIFVGSSTKSGVKGISNKIMQLRKICNHPFVFEEVENLVNPEHDTNDDIWRCAGKFELLDRILPKFKKSGHRVLMFFQMTQVMDIMEDYLRFRSHEYLRLDGSTKADDRSALLKLFNAPDSPYFTFLLSTRAGGLGLNLQTADTVIIFDSDWNPHQDLQAQDRAHRIGQTKEVRILRLITKESVEEAILSRAHAKLEIDGKVIQAGKFDNKSTSEEQEAFLRKLLEEEDAKKNRQEGDDDMTDEELNEILARTPEEVELFNSMDQKRYASSKQSRLVTLDELPEIYQGDVTEALKSLQTKKEEPLGRGARDRKRVYYDDGLTEEQFLAAVNKDADALAQAIEKKRARSGRRKKQFTPDPESESEIDVKNNEIEEEPPQKKRRGRHKLAAQSPPPSPVKPKTRGRRATRNRPKIEDEDEDDNYELNESPKPVARKRSRSAISKSPIHNLTQQLLTELRDLRHDDDTLRSLLFEELPSPEDYPDYYELITSPVSLQEIEDRNSRNEYDSLSDVKSDVIKMCKNAMKYNTKDSEVYEDATIFKDVVDRWFKENK